MHTFSLTQLANFFRSTRETVSRRLDAAGVQPDEIYRGNARYTLRDAANAWYMPPTLDPDDMPPFARRAHYSAELLKLNVQNLRAELLDVDDVEREYQGLINTMVGKIDQLSRDIGHAASLTDSQLTYVRKHLRECRSTILKARAGK